MGAVISLDKEYVSRNKKYLKTNGEHRFIISQKNIARINKYKGVMQSVLEEFEDGETLFLQGCIVHEPIDFSHLNILHACMFESVVFEKGFTAHHANFTKGLTYAFCTVNGDINLSHAMVQALETSLTDENYVVASSGLYMSDLTIDGSCTMPYATLYDFECRYSECKQFIAKGIKVQENFYIEEFVCENVDISHAAFCLHYHEAIVQDALCIAHTITCKNSLSIAYAMFYQPPCMWDIKAQYFSIEHAQYAPYIQRPNFNIIRTDKGALAIKTSNA